MAGGDLAGQRVGVGCDGGDVADVDACGRDEQPLRFTAKKMKPGVP